MEKPYIISGEFDLKRRPQQDILRSSQLENVRESLVRDLESMGKNVVWIPAREIADGINTRVLTSKLPIVSLDEVYVTSPDAKIGISRGIDSSLKDIGYVPRVGYGSIQDQFDSIAKLGPEVQVVDDVLFSGEMMSWVIGELEKRNVTVGRVVCGIVIKDGVEVLNERDIPVESVFAFEDVEDEVCERDLFVSRGSGRRLGNDEGNALYFDTTNGLPEEWASIPIEYATDFCLSSLERSLQLLRPNVPMREVGRFYGYQTNGLARKVLQTRIEEGI